MHACLQACACRGRTCSGLGLVILERRELEHGFADGALRLRKGDRGARAALQAQQEGQQGRAAQHVLEGVVDDRPVPASLD
jgi:hypothetical protein